MKIARNLHKRKMIFNHNMELMKKVFGRNIVTDDKDYEVLPFYGFGTNGWHYY